MWYTVEELKQKIKEQGGHIRKDAKHEELISICNNINCSNSKELTQIGIVIKTIPYKAFKERQRNGQALVIIYMI